MSKHTPGTWEVGFGPGVYGPRTSFSCYLDGKGFYEFPIRVGRHTVAWIATSKLDGREEADARLIAAAPALLDALKALTHSLDFADLLHDDQRKSFHVAMAAIAKATGEQP